MEPWTINEASKLVKAIKDEAYGCGFFPTLGGSVLFEGRSKHDLDLYFLPTTDGGSPKRLVTSLAKAWGRPRNLLEDEVPSLRTIPNNPFTSGSRPPTRQLWADYVANATTQSAPTYYDPPELPISFDIETPAADPGLEELRRESRGGWEFTLEPSSGRFRYSLRFYRGEDTIDVTIV